MNTIARLDTIVQALVDELQAHPFAKRLHAGTLTSAEYTAFLLQTYHYVVHTKPHTERAGHRLVQQGKTSLGQLFLHKASEEDGHDVWLLEDLRAIGRDPRVVHLVKPVPAVQAFVAWNGFVVESGSPIGLLGAAYVLEKVSASHASEAAKNLVANSGISGIAQGVRFLNGHGDADIDHIAALGQFIESLVATSPAYDDAIVATACVAQATYAGMYAALALEAHTKMRIAASTYAHETAQ